MVLVTTPTIDGRPQQTLGLVTSTSGPRSYQEGLKKLMEQATLVGANAIVGLIVQSVDDLLIFFGTAVKVS